MSRKTLIDAARAVFAEQGYAAGSMAAVAERVGIRKASLFHHFESKEALYLEVMWKSVEEIQVMLNEARQSALGSFEARLDALTARVNEFLGRQTDAARLLFRDLLFNEPFFAGPGLQVVHATFDLAVRFLEDGMAHGALPRQDARQLMLSLVGMHFVYWTAGTLRPEDKLVPRAQLVAERGRVMRVHVRRACGLPD